MSETAPDTTAPVDAPAQEQPPKPETDWKAEARKWEQRAKEYKPAADKLAEITEASKSEAEKQAERLKALEAEASTARSEALRLRIAAKHGIGDEQADLFLTGSDEETLTRQAQALAALASDRKKNGNHVPREGTPTSTGSSDERQLARELFAG